MEEELGKVPMPTNSREKGKGSPEKSKHNPQEAIAQFKPRDPEIEEDLSEEEER